MVYHVTETERSSGYVDPDKLNAITSDINQNGFAVVSDLISQDTCALLSESILEDVTLVKSQDEPTQHEKNTGMGHLQLGLRRYEPYVKAELVANPLIECIVTAVLGKNAWLGFYNGNVNLPGSTNQPLHFDRPFSWKTPEEAEADGESWPPRTTTLSCSIALTEINTANGATEIHPRSQHNTAVANWPPGERLKNHPELTQNLPTPERMEIPAGGICFRDPRMWHRGVSNNSDEVRPMIALTYHSADARHWRGWYIRDMADTDVNQCRQDAKLKLLDDGTLGDGRLLFDRSAMNVFDTSPNPHHINRNVRFTTNKQSVDHLHDAHLLGGARLLE